MQKDERNNLGYLGEDFQINLVKTFLTDKEFFKNLASVIDQNMFTQPQMRMIVGIMKDYYEKRDTAPNYEVIEASIRDLCKGVGEAEIGVEQLNRLKNMELENIDFYEDMSSKFFKQQNIVKAANQVLRIAEKGDLKQYQTCVDVLQVALNAGEKEEMGHSVFEGLEETLSDDYRVVIPTGIDKLDEALEGGIGKGELGVIIGSSSFGKTSMTTALCSHAATCKCEQNNGQGFKVLQIVFEDRIKQIQRKHIGRITGVEAKDLSKRDYVGSVMESVKTYTDFAMMEKNLRIVKFPSGEITASKIKSFVKKLINSGFKPDLMVVDYFECLEHERGSANDKDYEREGKTMRKFESMAGELDMAIWIPSQGSRDSINMEVVTMDKISGSIKKVQIAHIIVSIARTMDDIANNKAVLSLLKNRAGKAGAVWNNVDFNNGTCIISTDNVDEFSTSKAFVEEERKKDNKEILAEIMKNRR